MAGRENEGPSQLPCVKGTASRDPHRIMMEPEPCSGHHDSPQACSTAAPLRKVRKLYLEGHAVDCGGPVGAIFNPQRMS